MRNTDQQVRDKLSELERELETLRTDNSEERSELRERIAKMRALSKTGIDRLSQDQSKELNDLIGAH